MGKSSNIFFICNTGMSREDSKINEKVKGDDRLLKFLPTNTSSVNVLPLSLRTRHRAHAPLPLPQPPGGWCPVSQISFTGVGTGGA